MRTTLWAKTYCGGGRSMFVLSPYGRNGDACCTSVCDGVREHVWGLCVRLLATGACLAVCVVNISSISGSCRTTNCCWLCGCAVACCAAAVECGVRAVCSAGPLQWSLREVRGVGWGGVGGAFKCCSTLSAVLVGRCVCCCPRHTWSWAL